jgi:adenosylcobinamide amidohydrolase
MEILKTQPLLADLVLEVYEKRLVIKSGFPLRTVSSAVYFGGRQDDVRSILNLTVHKGYHCSDPCKDMRREILAMGLPEQTVGLMTAVDAADAAIAIEEAGGHFRVATVVTAGTGNAWRAGVWPSYLDESGRSPLNPYPYPPGTVNIIVLVEGKMAEAAMINAAMTVTEAKTAVFFERGIRCPASGKTATGTTTDAVVIASTGRGEHLPYGGPGTLAGTLIARSVTRALNEALDNYDRKR